MTDKRVAFVTGGSRGIGAAIVKRLAKDGLHVVAVARNLDKLQAVVSEVTSAGGSAEALTCDIADSAALTKAIEDTIEKHGHLDVLVNNAAEQHPRESIAEISADQLERTFRTNIFSMFYLTQAALPHLHEGSAIVNTTSVTAYRGSPTLLDYAATKGAIVAFTRSLAESLADKHIRVNAVAPGPVWTPLIPSTFPPEKVATFGSDVPLKRAGEPEEIAPSYVFLASQDASYMTGQVLHPNGGEIING